MKIFLDTVDCDQISKATQTGLIDGITTNPSLIASSGQDFIAVIEKICKLNLGAISAEVVSSDYDNMLREADILSNIADNIVVKLPLTPDGLRVCKALSNRNIKTNVTLCFSANQALLAAKAGATYISPFIGRLDDIGQEGVDLIAQIRHIYDIYHFETQILAASIRHVAHVTQAMQLGADVATIPTKVFEQLYHHPLTDKGLDIFMQDWKKTGQSI